MLASDPCEPNLVLNKLKGTRLWTDKKKLIKDTIDKCGKKTTRKKKGEKRAMSGWNCYLKICSQESGMDFQKCMSDKNRKAKEYMPNTDYYSKLAGNGCK